MANKSRRPRLTIVPVADHPFDDRNLRGIALVESDTLPGANAGSEMKTMRDDYLKGLSTGFQMWKMRARENPRQHGFNGYNGRFKNIWRFAHDDLRIYGFLAHPSENNRALICCLFSAIKKDEWNSDETDLERTESARTYEDTQEAVDNFWKQLQDEEE